LRVATLARRHIHIDEVQHVIAPRDCSRKTTSVVPRNVYRRCLVRPLLSRRRQAFPDRGSGPQGLRRPRFSFFRYTCQTARDQEDPLSETPESRRSPKPPTETGCLVTLSVRSFAGAPSRRKAGGAPLWGLYRVRPRTLSTAQLGKILGKFALWIAASAAVLSGLSRTLGAALAPHSSRVVCAGERPMVAARIK